MKAFYGGGVSGILSALPTIEYHFPSQLFAVLRR
jgi:hypothetical protein